MKRILYLSCHEILEYDELRLFSELGHECYSLGAYTMPGGQENRKRPPLQLPYDPHFIELATRYNQENIHPEMLKGIHIVIVMHVPDYITKNWDVFREFIKKGGRVIWRSIGQSIPHVENQLRDARAEGLEVVRYSPEEDTIEGNIGSDACIRFYKDPEEFNDWNGVDKRIINFTQSLQQRSNFTGYSIMRKITKGINFKVYGPGNEDLGDLSGGLVSFEVQKGLLRTNRAYLYHGTYPASYTLSFIEAWMTGIPMICVGEKYGNSDMFPNQKTYEIPSLITSGVDGFVSDDITELREHIQLMFTDRERAKAIGAFGRAKAISIFGKAKIKAEWKSYLDR